MFKTKPTGSHEIACGILLAAESSPLDSGTQGPLAHRRNFSSARVVTSSVLLPGRFSHCLNSVRAQVCITRVIKLLKKSSEKKKSSVPLRLRGEAPSKSSIHKKPACHKTVFSSLKLCAWDSHEKRCSTLHDFLCTYQCFVLHQFKQTAPISKLISHYISGSFSNQSREKSFFVP